MKRAVHITLTELLEKDRFYKSEAAEVFTRSFCERLEASGLDNAGQIVWLDKLEAFLKAK